LAFAEARGECRRNQSCRTSRSSARARSGRSPRPAAEQAGRDVVICARSPVSPVVLEFDGATVLLALVYAAAERVARPGAARRSGRRRDRRRRAAGPGGCLGHDGVLRPVWRGNGTSTLYDRLAGRELKRICRAARSPGSADATVCPRLLTRRCKRWSVLWPLPRVAAERIAGLGLSGSSR
jgi:hypothetical protein